MNKIVVGDVVSFWNGEKYQIGTVYVMDKGSLEFPDKITYDIIGSDGILYKKVFPDQIDHQ